MQSIRIAVICFGLVGALARADEVNLFPQSALGAAVASPDTRVALQVDAPWRAVVRGITLAFQPPVSTVTREDPIRILARQVARQREPAAAPPNRSTDRVRDLTTDGTQKQLIIDEQVTAAQEAFEEPAVWERVELEAVVEEAGAPVRVRVTKTSNRFALDEEALRAAKRVLGTARGLAERGPVVVRLTVEAGVSVAMPGRVVPAPTVRAGPAGVMVPVARGRFGDGKKTEVTAPLQPRVRTRVQIISIER